MAKTLQVRNVPDDVHAELRRRVRLEQTPAGRAERALAELAELAAVRWDHEPLLRRAWQLRENVTTCDAVYVALAEGLDAPLVTTDVRLSNASGLRCPVEVLVD